MWLNCQILQKSENTGQSQTKEIQTFKWSMKLTSIFLLSYHTRYFTKLIAGLQKRYLFQTTQMWGSQQWWNYNENASIFVKKLIFYA